MKKRLLLVCDIVLSLLVIQLTTGLNVTKAGVNGETVAEEFLKQYVHAEDLGEPMTFRGFSDNGTARYIDKRLEITNAVHRRARTVKTDYSLDIYLKQKDPTGDSTGLTYVVRRNYRYDDSKEPVIESTIIKVFVNDSGISDVRFSCDAIEQRVRGNHEILAENASDGSYQFKDESIFRSMDSLKGDLMRTIRSELSVP